jgi:type I restriction enzyme S subunit
MKYQAYKEYKPSGTDWIAEIPRHWETILFKRVVAGIKDGTHGTYSRVADGVPFLSAKNVQNNGIEINEAESMISIEDHNEITSNGFPVKGDLLITCVGTIGRTCVYEFEMPYAFQRSVAFLRLSEIADPKFYKYFVESKPYQSQLEAEAKASAQSGIYMGDLVRTSTVFPFLNEQTKIANFLDHETAKIDTLIEKQQHLIILLKEKRQAVISHAVTKGLNPNSPMRDSGVEWLGEVPEHWNVLPLKYVCKLIDGDRSSTYPNENDMVDEGIPFVSSKNIVNYKLTTKSLNYITREKFENLSRGKLIDGDLVITVRGTIGHVGIFDPEIIGCETGFINAQMMIIRPARELTDYLQLLSESSLWQSQLDVAAYGSTVKQLSNEVLGNVIIALPTSKEISEFIANIKQTCEKFELLVLRSQTAIDLMHERRIALISSAVTGKIDVRSWQSPEPLLSTKEIHTEEAA